MDVPQIDGVTVGYGVDDAMCGSWGDEVEWWETIPPQEECTRFRVFYPDEYETVPRIIVDVMAALGAWRVWTGSAAAVAPDGERTGDVRDRMDVAEHSTPQDDLEPRTRRAVDEEMSVSLLEKDGRYEVRSASGNWYEVDVISESCTCPDWRKHTPEGGYKYLRRVDHEIKQGRLPFNHPLPPFLFSISSLTRGVGGF